MSQGPSLGFESNSGTKLAMQPSTSVVDGLSASIYLKQPLGTGNTFGARCTRVCHTKLWDMFLNYSNSNHIHHLHTNSADLTRATHNAFFIQSMRPVGQSVLSTVPTFLTQNADLLICAQSSTKFVTSCPSLTTRDRMIFVPKKRTLGLYPVNQNI